MVKTKIAKAAGRYGVRYGQSIRRRIAAVESKQRKKQQCIFCNGRAKRTSKGIWNCIKCGKRFAGHAYYLERGVGFQQAIGSPSDKLAKEKKTKSLKKEKTSNQ